MRIDRDLQDLIPGYLENRRGEVTALREALSRGDFETLRVTGHGMKGSGGGYGFDRITEIGQAIEQAARNNHADIIRENLDLLSDYLDRLEVCYE